MLSAIEDRITETRAVISSLHPATSRELGFEASLRAAIAPFPASRSVELTVQCTVADQSLAVALLRIAQELTVNAVKHARPRHIDVRVSTEAEEIVLEVNDDGVGIDSSDASHAVQAGYVGLAMVRRRVQDGGGQQQHVRDRDAHRRRDAVARRPAASQACVTTMRAGRRSSTPDLLATAGVAYARIACTNRPTAGPRCRGAKLQLVPS